MTVLAPDDQRILDVWEERRSAGKGLVMANETAAELGTGMMPGEVERVRSKARRLAERGWLLLDGAPHRGCSVQAGRPFPCRTLAHPRDHRPPVTASLLVGNVS
ncbi:hypothetical protein ACFVHW_29390 [Streptomyces sp. NPDC127110]|uniref:hypothetical protein n=1 Tax=Streptomyces sp. NPDC127110 TaxID=3345362 RepID=UPI0036268ED6